MNEDRDQEPLTAVSYLYEVGETTVIIDLLTDLLVSTGITEEQVAKALEAKAGRWLEDQREQWWEF